MRLWLARLGIGIVFIMNLQAALAFLIWPERYAPAYELYGASGEAALRGVAVLFLMWNVPYALALWHPARRRISLYEAIAMQTIGLVGEGWIYTSLPAGHVTASASILRFILFDGSGLLLLLFAAWVSRKL